MKPIKTINEKIQEIEKKIDTLIKSNLLQIDVLIYVTEAHSRIKELLKKFEPLDDAEIKKLFYGTGGMAIHDAAMSLEKASMVIEDDETSCDETSRMENKINQIWSELDILDISEYGGK
jgi:hypothetical protein